VAEPAAAQTVAPAEPAPEAHLWYGGPPPPQMPSFVPMPPPVPTKRVSRLALLLLALLALSAAGFLLQV
jgi:hypothetical protein